MRPSGCCMGNVGGEAGGTHFLLFGPRTPQPPSHPLPSTQAPLPPQASPTSTVPPRKSLLFSRLRDSRLAPTAPNLSRRVLQGLTHVGMEAEPLIPSNPFFNPAPSLPPPCPGGGSHLEAWAPALCLHHPRLTQQVPGPPAGTTAAPHSSLPPPPSTPRSVLLLQLPEMLPESAQTRPCFSEIYSSPSVYLGLNLPPGKPVGEALPPLNITSVLLPSKPGSLSPLSSPRSSPPQGTHRVGCAFFSCSLTASPEGSHCLDSTEHRAGAPFC